ncbi:hypothetical protein RRG08_053617 [Elysia crispata]|uniref:Uncharacterized protein n=1 Tax=Elysia crispata TaxID=231223 RepID=A0AAE1CRD8_9GAST|nr:hypothetical protein RRG08_053617 [Elysia crispata]
MVPTVSAAVHSRSDWRSSSASSAVYYLLLRWSQQSQLPSTRARAGDLAVTAVLCTTCCSDGPNSLSCPQIIPTVSADGHSGSDWRPSSDSSAVYYLLLRWSQQSQLTASHWLGLAEINILSVCVLPMFPCYLHDEDKLCGNNLVKNHYRQPAGSTIGRFAGLNIDLWSWMETFFVSGLGEVSRELEKDKASRCQGTLAHDITTDNTKHGGEFDNSGGDERPEAERRGPEAWSGGKPVPPVAPGSLPPAHQSSRPRTSISLPVARRSSH